MTGAILGGSSVQQAAKLQMIIMFLISSSTALASICSAGYATSVVVDQNHRIRQDRIYSESLFSFSPTSWIVSIMRSTKNAMRNGARSFWTTVSGVFRRGGTSRPRSGSTAREERGGLLERGFSYDDTPLSSPTTPLTPNRG